jgi:hypothetical protein
MPQRLYNYWLLSMCTRAPTGSLLGYEISRVYQCS